MVNLMAASDGRETVELAFYYPVSPSVACLVAPRSYRLHSQVIPSATVEELNNQIARESEHFLVAKADRTLLRTVESFPSMSRSRHRILESLSDTH